VVAVARDPKGRVAAPDMGGRIDAADQDG